MVLAGSGQIVGGREHFQRQCQAGGKGIGQGQQGNVGHVTASLRGCKCGLNILFSGRYGQYIVIDALYNGGNWLQSGQKSLCWPRDSEER